MPSLKWKMPPGPKFRMFHEPEWQNFTVEKRAGEKQQRYDRRKPDSKPKTGERFRENREQNGGFPAARAVVAPPTQHSSDRLRA